MSTIPGEVNLGLLVGESAAALLVAMVSCNEVTGGKSGRANLALAAALYANLYLATFTPSSGERGSPAETKMFEAAGAVVAGFEPFSSTGQYYTIDETPSPAAKKLYDAK